MSTIEFYNQHSQDFFTSTVNADVGELYRPFLQQLPTAGRILDAGCGSGRDSKAFMALGYQLTAIDASAELAKAASEHIGKAVTVCQFNNIDQHLTFDGIWACASLLHVKARDLPHTFRALSNILINGGIFYCSFKYGDKEREHNGRFFTDTNETLLQQWLDDTDLIIQQSWITADVRPDRENEKWLNAILIKKQK
jgi:SAM-dependent methyltransferase